MSNSNEIPRVFDHVLSRRPVAELKPYARNARTHNPKQIQQIAASIREFGFTVPVLIDAESTIIAGHARVEAAKRLGMECVPVIQIDHLTQAQKRAYIIADNRLAELAGWDEELLAVEFKFLTEIDIEFDVGITGFETAEIDLLIEGVEGIEAEPDPADEIPEPNLERPAVSQPGDMWLLGANRLLCGDARDMASYEALMAGQSAQMVFADPPYNVPISGHVCGLGKAQHRDFAMAAGEMSEEEFVGFLKTTLGHCAAHCIDGAINFICMDWRHMGELIAAGRQVYSELKNLCVWNKSNAGMGSFYRSKHELIFVYKSGTAPHINNFGLGERGRYRTNIWSYASMSSFGADRDEALAMHPTVKPVALVADALRDVSKRGGIVLDAFAGSGTTIVASERTGRVGYVMEIDGHYVDVAIRRWQEFTGGDAIHAGTGQTFAEICRNHLELAIDPRTASDTEGREVGDGQ
ncbi:MAG: site-specific DNA-methyltransferase [Proteobacteria bacterium]|nr:site-specific DNA-methyltransferase [Pseudomonadota bacterium]